MAASIRSDIRPKKDKNRRLLHSSKPHQLDPHRELKLSTKDFLKSPLASLVSDSKSPTRYPALDSRRSPSKDDLQVFLKMVVSQRNESSKRYFLIPFINIYPNDLG